MCKRKIDDLGVGDEVVIVPGGEYEPYKIGTVEKVTKTQITVSGQRFNRRDGVKIGDGNTFGFRVRVTKLALEWKPQLGMLLMTVEEAQKKNKEKQAEVEIRKMVNKIQDAKQSHLQGLPVETLQEVIKLLKLEE